MAAMAIAFAGFIGIPQADGQPPSVVQANLNYEASGFLTPAGMAPPSMYQGAVQPVGYAAAASQAMAMQPMGQPGYVSPVGFMGSDCDGMYGGCDGCGMACGGSHCGMLGCGGVLGKLHGEGSACGGCGMQGCPSCGGLSNLRHLCLFCQGDGCSFCQSIGRGYVLGALGSLKPFGTCCQQRWYDFSAELMFLSHSNGSLSGPLTTQGVAPGVAGDPVPANQVVLSLGDADGGDDLEAGARLSAAVIFGPGGNLEVTYIGGHEWSSSAIANSATPTLFSFISDFGRNPIGGFDETDRSIQHSVSNTSSFHSGELNYRRRTVGPYCKFQGSWLVGLRYVRYNDRLAYSTFGDPTRFFNTQDALKNNLFGPQAGFDLWWNVHPGINFGMGVKAAWVQNDVKRNTFVGTGGLVPGAVVVESGDRYGTVMGDFEAKLIYRISHSWAFRSTYYAMAVDKAAFGTTDLQTINNFINAVPIPDPPLLRNSLVVQGFSFGAEYTW